MDAAQLGQVQQQIHQELTAVRELVSVQHQQLAVLQQEAQAAVSGQSGQFHSQATRVYGCGQSGSVGPGLGYAVRCEEV